MAEIDVWNAKLTFFMNQHTIAHTHTHQKEFNSFHSFLIMKIIHLQLQQHQEYHSTRIHFNGIEFNLFD